jgi:hypothetical protein
MESKGPAKAEPKEEGVEQGRRKKAKAMAYAV